MMKFAISVFLSGIVVAGSALAQSVSTAGATVKPRAVIELFTSQGCSSCPPADRLMTELSKDPSLIVLTMPVDYWDYLGWKDTLADAAFTRRQKGYSAVRGDRQVYTPQAVINGDAHVVGSQRNDIEKAVIATRTDARVLSVDVSIHKVEGGFKANVAASPGLTGELWAMPVLKESIVQIGRGENTGRSVTYSNVVRGMVRLGVWNGNAMSVDVPKTALPAECDSFVVILQGGSDRKPSQIIGAAKHSSL